MSETENKFAKKKTSAWEQYTDDQLIHCHSLAEEYKTFLNEIRTEREAVDRIKKNTIDANKQYFVNKEKDKHAFLIAPSG